MRASCNQKEKEKAERDRVFQPIIASGTFHSRNDSLSFFPQISSSEQLQRMYSEQCIIHSCSVTFGEKQECLLSRGVIYHGKYVRPRPVKGWWFCSGITSDIRLYVGRGLIKATSITQPDNLCTQKNKWWLLASLNSLSHIFILFIYCRAILSLFLSLPSAMHRVLPRTTLLHPFTVW